MVTGLRIDDAPRLQALLAHDQRLFMRIGALLKQQLACTEALLQAREDISGVSALLQDRRLGAASEGDAGALIAEHCGPESEVVLVAGAEGWRVLALQDEVDNPLMGEPPPPESATAESSSGTSEGPLEALLPRVSLSVQPAIKALLAASSDDARAAALEQLRYLNPPLELQLALMPLLLSDGSAAVRDAGRRLLGHSGASPLIGRLLEVITEPVSGKRQSLIEELPGLRGDDAELAIAAIIAALESEVSGEQMLTLAEALATPLSESAQLAAFLHSALEHGHHLSLLGLARLLQRQQPERVNAVLAEIPLAGPEHDARLLSLLVAPETVLPEDLLTRALDLLLGSGKEPIERMPIAAALARCGNRRQAAAELAARSNALRRVPDSAAIWLIGEYAGDGLFTAEHTEPLLDALLYLLEHGSGPQVTTLLEQRLPAPLPLQQEQTARCIQPLGELAGRVRSPRNLDLIQSLIIVLAPGNDQALWRLIEEHPDARTRQIAINALPKAVAQAVAWHLGETVQRLFQAQARSPLSKQRDHANEQGLLLVTAAGLLHSPAMSEHPELAKLIAQMDTAAVKLGPYGWPALGLLAAGALCDPARRSELIHHFLRQALREVSDQGTRQIEHANQDNPTFIFDASLADHTHFVPHALEALERIAQSSHTPPPLLRHVVDRLSEHFLAVAGWQVVWAPGNIMQLGKLLAGLAANADFPPHLRRRIVEALMTRLSQPEMARHLARVLAADSQGELTAHAVRSANGILSLHAEGRYLDDERGELAATLVAFLHIPDFADDDDLVRRRLATTLSSLKRHVSAKDHQRLQDLLAGASPELRERLPWAVSQP